MSFPTPTSAPQFPVEQPAWSEQLAWSEHPAWPQQPGWPQQAAPPTAWPAQQVPVLGYGPTLAVQQQGELVIPMAKGVQLPMVCPRCGSTNGKPKLKKMTYVPPYAYVGLFAGVLPFVILALIVQKHGSYTYLQCSDGCTRRIGLRRALITTLTVFTMFAGLVLSVWLGSTALFGMTSEWFAVIGVVSTFAALVGLGRLSRKTDLMARTKLSKELIRYKGVHPNLLAHLPQV
jgi:hypothetical protein